MRLSLAIILCLVSVVALAHKPTDDQIKDGWVLEYTDVAGGYERLGGYTSKAACEAALPTEIVRVSGYNGHCIQFMAKGNYFIGSHDPAVRTHP